MQGEEQQYVDARELHPDFRRRDCWNCGHEWTLVRDQGHNGHSLKYGRCPECYWTGKEEITA